MNTTQSIQTHFPKAIPGDKLTENVNRILGEKGFTPKNTLFANSTCPDEINRFVTNFGTYWGENFPLGGLAGYPFTGATGFAAYSHHIPDKGRLFILYAAHIGINEKGELGKITRKGMTHETTSCGSGIGAYEALTKDPQAQVADGKLDPQQATIMDIVRENLQRIQSAEHPMRELPQILFEQIKKRLEQIIPQDYAGEIALLGGIQINTPLGTQDYFLPLDFRVINPSKSYREDLLQQL